MPDNLLIAPNGYSGFGLLTGDIDPSQFQAQQQSAGMLGLAQGLLAAGGASRLPVTMGAALGAGLQGYQQARSNYAQQALQNAQTQYTLANASKVGLEGQMMKSKMDLIKQYMNAPEPPMFVPAGSAGAQPAESPAGGVAAPGKSSAQSASPAVASYTADATLPPEARAFLDTVAGPESGGAYNIRYTPQGGATFASFDAHPGILEPGPQGKSSAAGRYQIVQSTWNPLADKYGISDFSPPSQDQGAWHLAQDTYQQKTGRDLLGDLQAGRTQDIPAALGGQWPTIGKAIGAYAGNLQKYTAGGAAVGNAPQPGDLPGVPDFTGMLAGHQGPAYAPQTPGPVQVAQNGPLTSLPGQGAPHFDLVEGDSIGVGLRSQGMLAGNPVGGRNPQAVLDNISANLQSDPNYYRGKNVILSGGTMNDPKGTMTGLIPQQIKAIQDAGGNVVLVGADTGKFAGRNDLLGQIAQQAKVPFAGPLPTNNVHPGPQGYRSYLRGAEGFLAAPAAGQPQATSAPQATGNGQPSAPGAAPSMPPAASAAYQQYTANGGKDSPQVWAARNAGMFPQGGAPGGAPQVAAPGAAPGIPQAGAAYQSYVQSGGKDTPEAWAARNVSMLGPQGTPPKGAPPPAISPADMLAMEAKAAMAGGPFVAEAKAFHDYAYPFPGWYRGTDQQLYRMQGGPADLTQIKLGAQAEAGGKAAGEYPVKSQLQTEEQNLRLRNKRSGFENVPGVGVVDLSRLPPGGDSGSAPPPPGGQSGVAVPVMTDAQKAVLDRNLADTENRLKGYHDEGRSAIEQVANAGQINDLLSRVKLGWNANTVQQGARILSALGASDDDVKQFLGTDPSAGDALNKLFLQFSAGAVRQMGAREPGSVISLFSKAYPNLETQPHAAELMNNALAMQAQWKTDRANAAEQEALAQQQGMGRFGENYKGLLGFEQKFAQTNNPRNYWRAAAAMSMEPGIAWDGLSAADKQRVYDLIPSGRTFRGGDGNLYRKPEAQ